METPVFLHVDFGFAGPWGPELAQACAGLAADIAGEPGLRWKVWGEDKASGRASGEYLFASRADAQRYLGKHVPRLEQFGVTDVHTRMFEVNTQLSAMTRAPATLASAGAWDGLPPACPRPGSPPPLVGAGCPWSHGGRCDCAKHGAARRCGKAASQVV